MTTAIFIQDQTEFTALRTSTPVLVVDCTATWCGPCKVISPLIDQLAANYSDRAKVVKLDIDSNKSLAKEFGLKSIPAVLFFESGHLIETMIGVKTYEEYSQTLDKYL
jgi:thioredoxin 1